MITAIKRDLLRGDRQVGVRLTNNPPKVLQHVPTKAGVLNCQLRESWQLCSSEPLLFAIRIWFCWSLGS